jgi:hypothetical protein
MVEQPGAGTVADIPDRRRNRRHPAVGRLRLWLLETLGFAEGSLVDISDHGIRFKPLGVLPYRRLFAGDAHRIEVYGERGASFSAMAAVRHTAGGTIGLEVVERVPVGLFSADPPANDVPPTRTS